MTTLEYNRQKFNLVKWCLAGLGILILLTSCSPLAKYEQSATETPAPSMTATATAQPVKMQATPRPSCTVTAYTLNLRTGAGMTYAVKEILTKGEAVTVLDRGEWLKVSTRNATGFIYARYCR